MTESRNPLLVTLIALQIATLSLLLLIFFNPPSRAEPGRVIVRGSSAAENVAAGMAELKAELRAILRAEIAALAPAPTPADVDAAPAPSAQDLEQQEQAVAASGSVIQQAIAAGVWTAADSQALIQHIGKVPPGQRLQLVEEFYAAINRQELQLDDFPPL